MQCAGASYGDVGGGYVAVNGQVPVFNTKTAIEKAKKAWSRYGGILSAASRRYQIPVAWLFGILMQESGGGEHNVSPCSACSPSYCTTVLGQQGCAFGIMQIIPQTARAYGATPEAVLSTPAISVDVAARLLQDLLKQEGGDIVRAATRYNAGSIQCGSDTFGFVSQGDYARSIVQWSNTGLALGITNAGGLSTFFATLAGVSVVGLYLTRKRRRA